MIDGINKRLLSWSNVISVVNGSFDFFQPTNLSIEIPNENQEYSLKADAWSGFAAVNNSFEIASNLIGIFSTTASTIFEQPNCAIEIGNLFVSNASLVANLVSSEQMSNGEALGALIDYLIELKDEIYGVTESCSDYLLPQLSQTAFGKILEKLSIIGNLENGAVLIFNVTDIALYQNQLEFCFQRTATEIVECESEINLTDCWYIQFNATAGNCSSYNLNFLLNEDNSITLVNNACIESNPIANDNSTSASYSLSGNAFNLNFAYDYGGTVDNITINGTYNETSDNITGTFNQTTTQNNNTINCSGNIVMNRN